MLIPKLNGDGHKTISMNYWDIHTMVVVMPEWIFLREGQRVNYLMFVGD